MDDLAKALEDLIALDPSSCNRPLDARQHLDLAEHLNKVFRLCKRRIEADAREIDRLTEEIATLRENDASERDRLAEAEKQIRNLTAENARLKGRRNGPDSEKDEECRHVFVTVTVRDEGQTAQPTEAVCIHCGATKPVDSP